MYFGYLVQGFDEYRNTLEEIVYSVLNESRFYRRGKNACCLRYVIYTL